jgi:hypothetical protein
MDGDDDAAVQLVSKDDDDKAFWFEMAYGGLISCCFAFDDLLIGRDRFMSTNNN